MFSDKMKAKIIGILFIAAAVTAIIGLVLYDPILNNPDYLIKGAENGNKIILGAVFELILAVFCYWYSNYDVSLLKIAG